MVSEPTSAQPVDPEVHFTDNFTERADSARAVNGYDEEQNTPPETPVTQPRWMTVSVALTGIIGLVVMIILVRG